jgi:hypothetical protein
MEVVKMLTFHCYACGLYLQYVFFFCSLKTILYTEFDNPMKRNHASVKTEFCFTLKINGSPFRLYRYNFGRSKDQDFRVILLLVLCDYLKATYIFEVWLLGYLHSTNFRLLFLVLVN